MYLWVWVCWLVLAKLALKLLKLLCSMTLLVCVVQQDGVVEVDKRILSAHRGGQWVGFAGPHKSRSYCTSSVGTNFSRETACSYARHAFSESFK